MQLDIVDGRAVEFNVTQNTVWTQYCNAGYTSGVSLIRKYCTEYGNWSVGDDIICQGNFFLTLNVVPKLVKVRS